MPRTRWSTPGLLTALTLLLVGVVVAPATSATSATSAAAAGAHRIMFYGDSVTQQSSGDVTWRCRVYDHLRRNGVAADLVGPRTDLLRWRTRTLGSQEYAGPACDRDHASLWGMTFMEPAFGLASTAANQSADVVVAYIGQNDLLANSAGVPTLVERMRAEIVRARQLRPGIDVVLVRDGEVWLDRDIPAYNDGLAGLAQRLDTPDARVVMTADPGLDRYRDTVDDNHVTASGEVRLAAVVTDALARIGQGPAWPRPLTEPTPGPGFAPTPTLSAAERRLAATWSLRDYADAERVAYRDLTAGGATRVTGDIASTRWATSALPGHVYEVRLQPVKGRTAGGTLSTARTVRVPARPAAATGLTAVRAGGCRVRATWRAATYATGYVVQLRDTSRRGSTWRAAHAGTVSRTTFTTGALTRKHRYAVRVRSYGPLAGSTTAARYVTSC